MDAVVHGAVGVEAWHGPDHGHGDVPTGVAGAHAAHGPTSFLFDHAPPRNTYVKDEHSGGVTHEGGSYDHPVVHMGKDETKESHSPVEDDFTIRGQSYTTKYMDQEYGTEQDLKDDPYFTQGLMRKEIAGSLAANTSLQSELSRVGTITEPPDYVKQANIQLICKIDYEKLATWHEKNSFNYLEKPEDPQMAVSWQNPSPDEKSGLTATGKVNEAAYAIKKLPPSYTKEQMAGHPTFPKVTQKAEKYSKLNPKQRIQDHTEAKKGFSLFGKGKVHEISLASNVLVKDPNDPTGTKMVKINPKDLENWFEWRPHNSDQYWEPLGAQPGLIYRAATWYQENAEKEDPDWKCHPNDAQSIQWTGHDQEATRPHAVAGDMSLTLAPQSGVHAENEQPRTRPTTMPEHNSRQAELKELTWIQILEKRAAAWKEFKQAYEKWDQELKQDKVNGGVCLKFDGKKCLTSDGKNPTTSAACDVVPKCSWHPNVEQLIVRLKTETKANMDKAIKAAETIKFQAKLDTSEYPEGKFMTYPVPNKGDDPEVYGMLWGKIGNGKTNWGLLAVPRAKVAQAGQEELVKLMEAEVKARDAEVQRFTRDFYPQMDHDLRQLKHAHNTNTMQDEEAKKVDEEQRALHNKEAEAGDKAHASKWGAISSWFKNLFSKKKPDVHDEEEEEALAQDEAQSQNDQERIALLAAQWKCLSICGGAPLDGANESGRPWESKPVPIGNYTEPATKDAAGTWHRTMPPCPAQGDLSGLCQNMNGETCQATADCTWKKGDSGAGHCVQKPPCAQFTSPDACRKERHCAWGPGAAQVVGAHGQTGHQAPTDVCQEDKVVLAADLAKAKQHGLQCQAGEPFVFMRDDCLARHNSSGRAWEYLLKWGENGPALDMPGAPGETAKVCKEVLSGKATTSRVRSPACQACITDVHTQTMKAKSDTVQEVEHEEQQDQNVACDRWKECETERTDGLKVFRKEHKDLLPRRGFMLSDKKAMKIYLRYIQTEEGATELNCPDADLNESKQTCLELKKDAATMAEASGEGQTGEGQTGEGQTGEGQTGEGLGGTGEYIRQETPARVKMQKTIRNLIKDGPFWVPGAGLIKNASRHPNNGRMQVAICDAFNMWGVTKDCPVEDVCTITPGNSCATIAQLKKFVVEKQRSDAFKPSLDACLPCGFTRAHIMTKAALEFAADPKQADNTALHAALAGASADVNKHVCVQAAGQADCQEATTKLRAFVENAESGSAQACTHAEGEDVSAHCSDDAAAAKRTAKIAVKGKTFTADECKPCTIGPRKPFSAETPHPNPQSPPTNLEMDAVCKQASKPSGLFSGSTPKCKYKANTAQETVAATLKQHVEGAANEAAQEHHDTATAIGDGGSDAAHEIDKDAAKLKREIHMAGGGTQNEETDLADGHVSVKAPDTAADPVQHQSLGPAVLVVAVHQLGSARCDARRRRATSGFL